MRPVLTAAEMAALDRYTIEQLGLDGRILMASAARECLHVLRERWPDCRRPLIMVGPGNNGGDGIALAYYAQAEGLSPTLLLCTEGAGASARPEPISNSESGRALGPAPSARSDPAYFLDICARAFVPTVQFADPAEFFYQLRETQADLAVDALFGTGLDRPLTPYFVELIDKTNAASLPRLAVDCPSGLDCTSGRIQGAAIRADCTVTFGYCKRGFFHPAALELCGKIVVADLGFAPLADAGISPGSQAWPDALWEPLRHARPANSHKGDYGKLLVVAGHADYPGAPRLAAQAAEAALRAGAGLVRLVVPESIHAICSTHPSIMCAGHAEDEAGGFAAQPSAQLLDWLNWCDALVLGPGLGDGEQPVRLAATLLAKCQRPVVLDADGLRALHSFGRGGAMLRPPDSSDKLGRSIAPPLPGGWPLILTPHLGELARLAGLKQEALAGGLFGHAVAQAQRYNVLVLAKSAQCVLASPSGALLFPHAGHPALATGGTGDVLSGIIGALLARWYAQCAGEPAALPAMRELTAAEIVCTAVNWHSAAATGWADWHGDNGMTAVELIVRLPDALEELRVAARSGNTSHL